MGPLGYLFLPTIAIILRQNTRGPKRQTNVRNYRWLCTSCREFESPHKDFLQTVLGKTFYGPDLWCLCTSKLCQENDMCISNAQWRAVPRQKKNQGFRGIFSFSAIVSAVVGGVGWQKTNLFLYFFLFSGWRPENPLSSRRAGPHLQKLCQEDVHVHVHVCCTVVRSATSSLRRRPAGTSQSFLREAEASCAPSRTCCSTRANRWGGIMHASNWVDTDLGHPPPPVIPLTQKLSEVSKRGWREGVGDKQTPKKSPKSSPEMCPPFF